MRRRPQLSEADILDLAGGYKPTVDDAERCLKNAARHLADAAVCSPESRLMHTELAIEEASKGILIHWRMDIQDSIGPPDGAVARFRILRPEVQSLLTEFHEVLGDKALQGSFKVHSVKLAHLRFLARVFGRELRGGDFVAWRPEKPYSDATIRVLAELGEVPVIARKGKAELSRIVKDLERLTNPTGPSQSLARLRERATYVDRGEADIGSEEPHADPAVSARLSEAAAFLVRTLAMATIIRRDRHPKMSGPRD